MGTDFQPSIGTTTVTFNGVQATSVVVVSGTEITADTPPGVAGPASVVVTDVGGSSPPGSYTYIAPPDVGSSGLSPAFGPVAGHTTVTVTGTGLTGISAVDFGGTCTSSGSTGGTPAIMITPGTDTSATAVTPPHAAGATLVCLTADGGTAPAAEPFTFVAVPTVSAFTPTSGPTAGGTEVTITGSGFAVGDPLTSVTFGGNAATDVVVVSSTEITADTPASTLPGTGAGPVNVAVSDSGGGPVIASQQFTYVTTPVVSGISPTSGPPSGGETVIVMGTDLCNTTSVLFGSAPGTVVSTSPDCTTLTVTAPPGQGSVPVTVVTAGGSFVAPETFTYIQPGYWMTAPDGGVFSFGGALFHGSMPGLLPPGRHLNAPVVAIAGTPDHGGYWLFAADGGVFAFGDAVFYGSVPLVLPGVKLNGPVVAAEATPDGHGYRMFAADGGVFDFGDAVFENSLPGKKIVPSAPIVGAATYPFGQGANPNNAGYWLVGRDGAVYAFANAPSTLGSGVGKVTSNVVALSATPTGNGYFIFEQNGAVLSFGDAATGLGQPSALDAPVVAGQATSTGKGYWEFAADGGVFAFGDAPFEGSLPGSVVLVAPITAGTGFGNS
jgi:hypothetical protein